jgi:hypothetical protein
MCRSLVARLGELSDPRDRRGRPYPMVGVLTLCLVAILAGHTTPEAIAQFGRLRQKRLGHALGFKNGTMPCANTVAGLLRGLDADHLDRLIGQWLSDRTAGTWDQLNLDGKVLRGSRDAEVPGVHLLAAQAAQVSAVIAQMTVEATTNEHKAALRLLDILPPLAGIVVTADALFTPADVATGIQHKGGDSILYAKKNQPELHDELARTFAIATSGDFSPGVAAVLGGASGNGHRGEQGPRPSGTSDDNRDNVAQ